MVVVVEVRVGEAIDTEADVVTIVVAAAVIDFVDVLSAVALDAWIDGLAGAIVGFVTGIGVEVLPDANALDFTVPKSLREFTC